MIPVSEVLGLQVGDAIAKIVANEMQYRFTRHDTHIYILTADYRIDRMNIEVDKNVVTKAYIG